MTPRRSRRRRAGASSAASSAPPSPNQLFVSDAHTAGRRRRLPRPRLQLPGRRRRHPHPGRSPGRQRRRRVLLGRDQPRRPLPLRRQHRLGARSPATRSGPAAALTFLQSTGPGQIGAGAEDARLSPDGSTLWVVESGTNAVTGFTVDGGTLTPLVAIVGPRRRSPLRHRRQLTTTAYGEAAQTTARLTAPPQSYGWVAAWRMRQWP